MKLLKAYKLTVTFAIKSLFKSAIRFLRSVLMAPSKEDCS